METSITPYVVTVFALLLGAVAFVFFLSLFLAERAFHQRFRRLRFLIVFPFLLVVSWLLAALPVSVIADALAERRWHGFGTDRIFLVSLPIISLLALVPFAILARMAGKFFGVTWRQSTVAAVIFMISAVGLSFVAYHGFVE